MQDRKLFGVLSGAQVTILGCVALLAPTALFAAVTFTPVAITDPISGKQAFVDGGRRLYTFDPIAGYANNPYNSVNFSDVSQSITGFHSVYTVPAGKALVLKSLTWSYGANVQTSDTWIDIFDGGTNVFELDTQDANGSRPVSFDSGLIFKSGTVNLDFHGAGFSYVFFQGYLVPLSALPAAGSAEAAAQFPHSAAPDPHGAPR